MQPATVRNQYAEAIATDLAEWLLGRFPRGVVAKLPAPNFIFDPAQVHEVQLHYWMRLLVRLRVIAAPGGDLLTAALSWCGPDRTWEAKASYQYELAHPDSIQQLQQRLLDTVIGELLDYYG